MEEKKDQATEIPFHMDLADRRNWDYYCNTAEEKLLRALQRDEFSFLPQLHLQFISFSKPKAVCPENAR